jgi:hypothetical protein
MTEPPDFENAAEQRLLTLLALLRLDEVRADPALTRSVIHTLHWQLMLRPILRAAGSVLGSIATAFSLLAGRSDS